MSIFSQRMVKHLEDNITHLFPKHTQPTTIAETESIVGKKLTAMAQLLSLSPYDSDGDFQGKVLSVSYSNIEPIRLLCPSNIVCISSFCSKAGRSLIQSAKREDIPNITLIKNNTIYMNVTLLSAQCPACKTIYHVDHEMVKPPGGGQAQVYLNSALYIKIGRRIWTDHIFSSAVLKGMYSFHASSAAYTNFWNLSYGSSNSHIWQAFIQESIRTIASASDTNLMLSPNTNIYEIAREAFTYLGEAGIIRAANGHSCNECAQPYKQTADVIHHNNLATVLDDNELSLPIPLGQMAIPSSSYANYTTQPLVKMIVVDGIVMGPTVSCLFTLCF